MGPKRRISFLAFFLIWARYKGWDVPQHHVRICVWLERFWWHGRVGVLEVFRGAAKSTIVAVFQAWILYLDQSVHILDQAADDKTARKLSRDTRHVLNRHPLCRGMLGRADQAVESINVLGNPDARNASVSAHGVLSNVTSSRAEIVIFDDVEVPKNTRSDAARAHLRERMDEATHILVPGGKKLYIGTPHAFDSIYDEQAAAGADVLKIPLFEQHVRYEQGTDAQKAFPYNFECNRAELHVFTGKGRASRLLVDGVDYKVDRRTVLFQTPPGTVVDIYGPSTWPARFNREDVEFRRTQSRTLNAWDSQYQLEAKPVHQLRLDPDRIIPYNVEPVVTFANGEVRMMLGATRIVGASAYWDCALGKVRGDDSALSLVFTNDRGQLFWHIARAMTGAGDVDAQCRQVRAIVLQYQLLAVTVETNGPGGFVPAILRKHLAGTHCAVLEQFQTGQGEGASKDARILDALEAPLSGRFLWAHIDALDTIEHQMKNWQPGIPGQRDDYLDSGAGAVRQTPVRIGKIVGKVDQVDRPGWRPISGEYDIQIGG